MTARQGKITDPTPQIVHTLATILVAIILTTATALVTALVTALATLRHLP